MEQELTSAAEQRAFAVAKLKRAASLPRMKDGRRPPMHVQAVSEGEKGQNDEDDEGTPPPEDKAEEAVEVEVEVGVEVEVEVEVEAEVEAEVEMEVEVERLTVTPEPAARTKRRSRSRSRSRGSKDLRGKARATQSPTSSPMITGDSSQDEAPPPPPPINMPVIPPLLSPIPSRFAEFQRSRLLRSPPPTSPEPSLFYPGTSPPTPIPLPTLEALQRGLFRSNSAGSSSTAGRRMAMHKLTGGTETYDPSPSPTSPPLPGKLGRNNTVSGGERTAARQFMLSRLGGRITKETDGEQASGGEEFAAPFPTPKRKRRRSRRGSAGAHTGVSDSEFLSTSPTTPAVPPTPLPPTLDNLPDFRGTSVTPNQAASPRNPSPERGSEFPHPVTTRENAVEQERPEPTRRRSVVVEEEEEEHSLPLQSRYLGLPNTPERSPAQVDPLRLPHTSNAPSNASTDSASASAIGVPVYLSQRTSPRHELFPSSPFTTPLKERPSRDEDEEEVLYPADTYRPRTPYDDHEREFSWVASPVPEIRMPIDDDEDDDDEEEEEEPDYDEPPLSPRSSNGFLPQEAFDDTSPRVSSDSKSLVVESETLSDTTPSFVPPSPSSVAALSQTASITRASDDSSSPQMYPTRLSVASRIQSDRSPLNTEFGDWDDRAVTNETPSKRNGEVTSTSTWGKVKNTFSRAGSGGGRRSRTNSIVTRERRDHTDSSISRESGASLTSTKTDRAESIGTFAHQQAQQPLMQSPSASASILSLAPHSGPRGGVSPVPPASSADLLKYQSSKLFPFPGMKKLEEQRNRAKGLPVVSASTPDVTFLPNGNDDDQPPHSSSSFSNTPAQTPEMGRDRRLSHQASDTRLLAKYNLNSPPISATPSSTSHPDYINITPPHIPSQTTSSINLKLPMTLPGVKQWLSKNNRKIFSSQGSSSSPSSAPISSPVEFRTSPNASKKPSLSDLLRIKKDNELGTDWEEIGSEKSRTPTSASGSTLLGKQLAATDIKESIRESIPPRSVNQVRTDHVDTEKTPKAKQVAPTPELNGEAEVHLHYDPPLTVTSPPEPPSSMTPDPSSSLSDYPAPSTSESSSTTSSQYSQYAISGNARSQGAVVLERLDENLARGPRSPMWADAIDDPARKLLRSIPVLQVVNPNTVKDRFLFLFSDLLVIAKPVIQDQDNIMDSYKPTPLDRKFIVKSVVLLRQLRFSGDRAEPQTKTTSYAAAPRNPLIRTFVHQFAKDADHAISSLFDKAGIQDDPIVLGQLLFKTLDLDRVRLGDYLSRRTSKVVLKAYVDSFGFTGMRVDRALRVFLYSINVPVRSSHNHSPLDYLLDAFASRWYEANARIVAYDKDLAIRLVRALVQLNELLHDGISQEPGPTSYPKRNITSRDFLEAFRRYDVRYLVSDELLEDVYESVLEEKLSQARNTSHGGPSDVTIMIKRPLPTRLTYKVQSDPIILRILQADPQLTIQLYGQDLIFEPSVLSFTKSLEASFRVMGTSLGSKTMIMCRSGPNALRYFGLPLSNSLMVERAFMRNTFQLAFSNYNGMKRRYMFSVDDPLIRHDWVIELKRQIDNATSLATAPSSPGASKFHRAAEHIAFKILQETLIGASPPDPLDKALQRLNSSPRHTHNGSTSRFLVQQRAATTNNARLNGFRFGPSHVRSKSRSQVYHRLGAGKNELDLNHNGTDSRGSREVDNNGREESTAMYDYDQPSRVEGPIWSGRDLAMQCQQNSSIALVLSFLQVGAPDHDQGGS